MGFMTKAGLATFCCFAAFSAGAHDIEQLDAPMDLGGFVLGVAHQ
jgi:hypothetical protein